MIIVVDEDDELKHKLDGISAGNEGFDKILDEETAWLSLFFVLGCLISSDFKDDDAGSFFDEDE